MGRIRASMTENQRESFRIDADPQLQAELFHEGRVTPCDLRNLSAGGARLRCSMPMATGSHCTLGVRIAPRHGADAGGTYVSFLMEVLESTAHDDDLYEYRLRNATGPGSQDYEAATKLVFEAQRRRLSAESGADESSPMASDDQRRRRLRIPRRPRFSRRSLRPGNDD
jgi:hypothetical protein